MGGRPLKTCDIQKLLGKAIYISDQNSTIILLPYTVTVWIVICMFFGQKRSRNHFSNKNSCYLSANKMPQELLEKTDCIRILLKLLLEKQMASPNVFGNLPSEFGAIACTISSKVIISAGFCSMQRLTISLTWNIKDIDTYTMRTNSLNWCNLVSISKKVVSYTFFGGKNLLNIQ